MIELDEHTKEAIRKMRRYHWHRSWAIFPRYCYLGHEKTKWFSTVFKGVKILNGPGEDIVVTKYATPEAFMIEKLKGNL